MTSLAYEDVYSQFFIKATAYDLAELSEKQANEMLSGWLRATASKPYVRKLFSSFSMDQDLLEINFEMKYKQDDESDLDFVLDVLALGMLMEWLRPHVNNYNTIAQVFGSKEEKWFSQAQHMSSIKNIFDAVKKEQRQMISDRGSAWNSYLNGE